MEGKKVETEKRLDLVEREAVKDAIGFMNLHFLGHGETKSVLDSINEVPTVDAVEVVRCGECKHFCEPFCIRRDDETHRERINMLTVDFCSYGERKDNA
jgi:MinD superfamily P-loop ATPase